MNPRSLQESFGGVTAVLVTPFDHDNRVDGTVLDALVSRIDKAGVHAITALGNTAEPFQLSTEERVLTLETIAGARRNATLIAGAVGGMGEVMRTIECASDLGYDAAMIHEPNDPLASDDALTSYALNVAERSPMPLVIYARSDRMSTESLARVSRHENVAGVKLAVGEMSSILALLGDQSLRAGCTWICGSAETSVPLFAAQGVFGFTSGLANLRPEAVLRFWNAARLCRSEQFVSLYGPIARFERLRIEARGMHNIAVVKHALSLEGFQVGNVRLPCSPMDSGATGELSMALQALDRALEEDDKRCGRESGEAE